MDSVGLLIKLVKPVVIHKIPDNKKLIMVCRFRLMIEKTMLRPKRKTNWINVKSSMKKSKLCYVLRFLVLFRFERKSYKIHFKV